ncbi:MAG TPA: DSD1 family PLP-dependent enzyme [Acidimicrobiia bacterium]|nr:DSD1 family PLP-dependent enzyme [Acidimicrobiia bacterium]
MTLSEIDTPALVLDLTALEQNLDSMAAHARAAGIGLRPHAKAHKSAWIAAQQIKRGAVGICCQKVSEAAAFVAEGFNSILISNEVVGLQKIRRMAELALSADISFCVDNERDLQAYDDLASEYGVRLGVLIDLQGGWYRPGVASTERVVDVAKQVDSFDHLQLRGLQAYNAAAQHIGDFDQRTASTVEFCERVIEAVAALNRAGLDTSVVSGGGTGTYDIDPLHGPYSEIQPGSYAFMDSGYLENRDADGHQRTDFNLSLFVLATIMSRPSPGIAIIDCGTKGISIDHGVPLVCLMSGARSEFEFVRAADEHVSIDLKGHDLNIGDRLLLVPHNVDPTVNLYDEYLGMRSGTVVEMFPVTARGKLT